jgi:hypothetical protein
MLRLKKAYAMLLAAKPEKGLCNGHMAWLLLAAKPDRSLSLHLSQPAAQAFGAQSWQAQWAGEAEALKAKGLGRFLDAFGWLATKA